MYEKPAAPLSIGGVVDDAIRLYRASFNRAWIPALIMQLLITGAWIFIRMRNPELGNDSQQLALAWSKMAPSFLALYAVAIVVSLIFSNAINAQLLAVREGQDLSIGGSLAMGMRYFLPMVGLVIVMSIAFAIVVMAAAASLAALPRPARLVLGLLYALLAIYLMGRIFLAAIALIGDRTGVLGALRASWRVTRQQWWRAAAIVTVVFVIFGVSVFMLGFVAGLINVAVRSGTVAGMLAVQLVAAVIQAATVPFFNAGFVSAYYDLKLRTQGTDLAARVEALGKP